MNANLWGREVYCVSFLSYRTFFHQIWGRRREFSLEWMPFGLLVCVLLWQEQLVTRCWVHSIFPGTENNRKMSIRSPLRSQQKCPRSVIHSSTLIILSSVKASRVLQSAPWLLTYLGYLKNELAVAACTGVAKPSPEPQPCKEVRQHTKGKKCPPFSCSSNLRSRGICRETWVCLP